MTIDEVKKDLLSKLDSRHHFFNTKILKNDDSIYRRRSFGDLFKHYRRYGVSQKILMQALIEAGFSAYICNGAGKFVFFHLYTREYKFSNSSLNKIIYDKDSILDSKYTFEYLEKIYDSIYKK